MKPGRGDPFGGRGERDEAAEKACAVRAACDVRHVCAGAGRSVCLSAAYVLCGVCGVCGVRCVCGAVRNALTGVRCGMGWTLRPWRRPLRPLELLARDSAQRGRLTPAV